MDKSSLTIFCENIQYYYREYYCTYNLNKYCHNAYLLLVTNL